ncbi:MAG: Flp family type IVb pilin [Novosphingobium pentaromativorans]|uniref:Flp family type IVb pilin n=1 Tax=Novosphingobium pentaromativorans TaxID=205844 RepID=A0A2W5QNT1_9SPHN|nr:MAG: Flp family type IVb pilin [Novosphingobium pentaromativorans]
MPISSIMIRLIKDKSGATAVEYGLILAMIVLAILVALNSLASETIALWSSVSDKSAAAISDE